MFRCRPGQYSFSCGACLIPLVLSNHKKSERQLSCCRPWPLPTDTNPQSQGLTIWIGKDNVWKTVGVVIPWWHEGRNKSACALGLTFPRPRGLRCPRLRFNGFVARHAPPSPSVPDAEWLSSAWRFASLGVSILLQQSNCCGSTVTFQEILIYTSCKQCTLNNKGVFLKNTILSLIVEYTTMVMLDCATKKPGMVSARSQRPTSTKNIPSTRLDYDLSMVLGN